MERDQQDSYGDVGLDILWPDEKELGGMTNV